MEHGDGKLFIELVEKYPCNVKDELHKKEGEQVKVLKPCLNLLVPGESNKEWI